MKTSAQPIDRVGGGIGVVDASIRLGVVGVGKFARDQHLPAIARDPCFALAATADPHAPFVDLPAYPSIEAMIATGPALDAVSICTPPAGRAAIARGHRGGVARDAGWRRTASTSEQR